MALLCGPAGAALTAVLDAWHMVHVCDLIFVNRGEAEAKWGSTLNTRLWGFDLILFFSSFPLFFK